MTSSVWGLLWVVGILASGTLGIFPQFGSHNRNIHSISPLIPRVSPQVPPRVYQHSGEIKSIEQTSDEVPSAESFQEDRLGGSSPRGFQQQQQQRGAHGHLTQEEPTSDRGGW